MLMPIAVKVVTDQQFAAWVANAKKKFASANTNTYAMTADAAQ